MSRLHSLVRTVQRAAIGAFLAGALCADPARAADDFRSGAKTAAEKTGGTIPPAPRPAAGGPGGLFEIEAIEASLAQAWERARLTQRHAFFVSERAELYGGYAERSSSTFAAEDKLVTYVEPVGYAWTPTPEGGYRFGFTLDFKVKTPDGKVLAGQDGFQAFRFTSRFKNREVFMNLTMSLTGIEPGSYVLVYTLHDQGSDKTSSFEQPFTIKG